MTSPNNIQINRRSALRGIVTLSGVAIALPVMGSLAGCSSGANASISDKMELIDAVSNLVIPQTDTPGARAAGVPAYIEAVFTDHFTSEQQDDFAAGLEVFDKLAVANGAENFTTASEEIQTKVLTQLGQEGEDSGSWNHLREMTIFGYYTSEKATEELAFEEIPGRYDGCMPLEKVSRAWLHRGV